MIGSIHKTFTMVDYHADHYTQRTRKKENMPDNNFEENKNEKDIENIDHKDIEIKVDPTKDTLTQVPLLKEELLFSGLVESTGANVKDIHIPNQLPSSSSSGIVSRIFTLILHDKSCPSFQLFHLLSCLDFQSCHPDSPSCLSLLVHVVHLYCLVTLSMSSSIHLSCS